MTVSRIRELMQERVVPESVLPQNIAAYLTDEDELPPELDAFTFLNRLRSLGIGSADFLYLLKGCGAPEEAVTKIEQHPDMNLQSLIVTLHDSGLTPKDYTRMLYTARQLWERTITMRIDLDEIQEETPPEQPTEPEKPEAPEKSENQERIKTARQKKKSEQEFHEYVGVKPIGKRNEPDKSEPEDTELSEEPEDIKPEKSTRIKTARQKKKSEQEFREYVGVKPIGRRNEPDLSDDPDETQVGETEEIYTAVQLKTKPEEETDENYEEPAEGSTRGRRGGIVAAAAGAAVLCALSAGIELMGFTSPENDAAQVHFAADNPEIFSEIYTAYNAGKIGGDYIQPMSDSAQAFGDLLISSGGQLGVFSSGNTVWAAESELITVYAVSGDEAAVTAEIKPPDGAQFLKVQQTENGIAAIFSGDYSCGISGIDSKGQTYISEQSGQLTEFYCSADIIRLGSVYTPEFTQSFTVDDLMNYLPWTAKGGSSAVLSPAEIAVSGSAQGCSYAVWAEYSTEKGEISGRMAALGNPFYSGAEFFTAAMYQDTKTLLLSLNGEAELQSKITPEITACAAGNGIIAAAERSADMATVYLLNPDLQPISGFTTGENISALRIDEDVIYITNGEKITMAADISDPASPKALELTAADGVINGEYALCGGKTSSGISITLYKLDGNKAVQADSYAKTLTEKELSSFSFRGINTAVVNGTELCGVAYRYFDGVSVVDEFAELGKSRSVRTLYDDPDGFTAAALLDNGLTLICGNRVKK